MKHVQVLPRPVDNALDEAGDTLWRFPPDIESEITTLATVCHVKRQQCTPLAAGREEDIHEADSSDDEGSENGSNFATDVAGRLGTSTANSIKMRFLDNLAEILCRKKDADFVTCTALMESEEQVTIFAARNAPWVKTDIELLEKLANMLEVVSSKGSLYEEDAGLIEDLSMYYISRLQHHAKALLGLLGEEDKMNGFKDCLNEFLEGNILPPSFVEIVDRLGSSTDFYSKLQDNFDTGKVHRQVQEIEFICRPHHSFVTFSDATREIPGLKRVIIVLLPGYESRKVPAQPSCSKVDNAKHQRRLDVALKKPKWIHAEMRMVLHLFSTDNATRMFPYLGISKKTCLLCGHVLSQLGIFQARNNHGKIYGQWTLPRIIDMPTANHDKLEATIQKLRDVLRYESSFEGKKRPEAVKESTISTPIAERQEMWSAFNRRIDDPCLHDGEIEWLSQHFERCTERFGRRNISRNHKALEAPPSELTDDEAYSNTASFEQMLEAQTPSCGKCGVQNDTLIQCQKCTSISYCDKDCMERDRIRHKPACRLGRPLDEVDEFIRVCREKDIHQIDNDVANAFGFCFFTSGFDRHRLFKLYCFLVNNLGLSEDELRDALKFNKLKEMFYYRGLQIPILIPSIRNEVLWLLQHDGFGSGAVTSWDTVLEANRDILHERDRTLPMELLRPREKLESYLLWCQASNGVMPHAEEDNWIYFGFCTASNASQTQKLGDLYKKLVPRANFEEFWQARVSSKIVELFQKHGLGDEIQSMRNFKTLMSAIGTWHQSVWELKRFTLLPEAFPFRAVYVDYGFITCPTSLDRLSLRDVYTQFFKSGGDEMALHQACTENRIADFLLAELGSLPCDAKLFESPYPLEDCNYMGMVSGTVILCPKSSYEKVKKLLGLHGEEGVIMAHPDEVDTGMEASIKDRAAFLGQGLKMKTTIIDGETIQTLERV